MPIPPPAIPPGGGEGAAPAFGGATPTIVPFKRLGAPGPAPVAPATPAPPDIGPAPAPMGGASALNAGGPDSGGPPAPGGAPAPGRGGPPPAPGAPGAPPGWFIMSIVPL